jgi:shikimate dehydrogenase
MTDRYAVIGNPIAHSRSPEIHARFARATGQDLVYERLLAPLDGFRATVDGFVTTGARGANVTVPFKLEAYDYATEMTDRARLAGAVNTLKFDSGRILGDNTDGVGLLRDITHNLHVDIAGARVLVLGAGGAARGIIGPLLEAQPAAMAISNRTFARAQELAGAFARRGVLRALPLNELPDHQFDLVINATSASLSAVLPAIPAGSFAKGGLAYDMMYGKGISPFMTLATQAGARSVDGLGMLVEQAAEAFSLWRGVRPPTAPVLAALRNA